MYYICIFSINKFIHIYRKFVHNLLHVSTEGGFFWIPLLYCENMVLNMNFEHAKLCAELNIEQLLAHWELNMAT